MVVYPRALASRGHVWIEFPQEPVLEAQPVAAELKPVWKQGDNVPPYEAFCPGVRGGVTGVFGLSRQIRY